MVRSLWSVVFVAVLSVACSSERAVPVDGPGVVVRISGSGTASPIVEELARIYGTDNPGVSFEFGAGTNTGGGITGVVEGTLDLAVANRPLTDQEGQTGVGYHPFAVDAMIFAVRLPNEVTSLSSEQVRSMYAGEIVNWSQLGGEDRFLVLLGRDADESATKLLLEPFMGGVKVSDTVTVLDRSSQMLDALSTTSGAIGYTSLGLIRLQGVNNNIAPVRLDGVEPGPVSLADGTYPWKTTFALISPPGGASGAAADFLAFATSPEAATIIEAYGYASPGR